MLVDVGQDEDLPAARDKATRMGVASSVFTGTPPGGIYISPASTGIPTLSKWAVAVTAVLILTAAGGLLRLVRVWR